jgi:hypothetical protein
LFAKPPASPLPPTTTSASVSDPIEKSDNSILYRQASFTGSNRPSFIKVSSNLQSKEHAGPILSTAHRSINNLLDEMKIEELITAKDMVVPALKNVPTTTSPALHLDNSTKVKLDLFTQNLSKSPLLIRQFFSSLPLEKEEGGLSTDEQSHIIHYGIKLETKVLELIDQYNQFIMQLGRKTKCLIFLEDVITEASVPI